MGYKHLITIIFSYIFLECHSQTVFTDAYGNCCSANVINQGRVYAMLDWGYEGTVHIKDWKADNQNIYNDYGNGGTHYPCTPFDLGPNGDDYITGVTLWIKNNYPCGLTFYTRNGLTLGPCKSCTTSDSIQYPYNYTTSYYDFYYLTGWKITAGSAIDGLQFQFTQSPFTSEPTPNPTSNPTTNDPTMLPTNPTLNPSNIPTKSPTDNPSKSPSNLPTNNPTHPPTNIPSLSPTFPTYNPSIQPTKTPTRSPLDIGETHSPSKSPTDYPSKSPSEQPSKQPSTSPTKYPSKSPSEQPTISPVSEHPTKSPVTEGAVDTTESVEKTQNTQKMDVNKGNEFDDWMYIVFGLGIICLCCILVVIICVIRRRRKANLDAEDTYRHQENAKTNTSDYDYTNKQSMDIWTNPVHKQIKSISNSGMDGMGEGVYGDGIQTIEMHTVNDDDININNMNTTPMGDISDDDDDDDIIDGIDNATHVTPYEPLGGDNDDVIDDINNMIGDINDNATYVTPHAPSGDNDVIDNINYIADDDEIIDDNDVNYVNDIMVTQMGDNNDDDDSDILLDGDDVNVNDIMITPMDDNNDYNDVNDDTDLLDDFNVNTIQ